MLFPARLKFPASVVKSAFTPTDNSALVAFRVIFGFLICYHCSFAFLSGAINDTYIEPEFTFAFIGFEFLKPLPGAGMYFYFAIMFLLGIMIMFAIFYRFAIIAFTVLWLALYLMQKADYNNHHYLILLLSFLMCFLPANRYFSFDVSRRRVKKSISCSRWIYWLIMTQMAIVYLFAAIHKLQPHWLSGKFLSIQFSTLAHHPILGGFYGNPGFAKAVSISGFLFDLLIIPLLLWKRTSIAAFFFSILFHLFNFYTFQIGIFPFLCIAANLFFVNGEIVRRILFPQKPPLETLVHSGRQKTKKWILQLASVYLLFQLLIPMRAILFPGNVLWTEEGYRMSWRMMLRTKSGSITFKVVDSDTKEEWRIKAADHFSPAHSRWLATSPDMIWQYAQHLHKEFKKKGHRNTEVYALSSVSLNREPFHPLVDSSVDLAEVQWNHFKHSPWILPHNKTRH